MICYDMLRDDVWRNDMICYIVHRRNRNRSDGRGSQSENIETEIEVAVAVFHDHSDVGVVWYDMGAVGPSHVILLVVRFGREIV